MPTRTFSNSVPLYIGTKYDWVYGNGPTESVTVPQSTVGYIHSANNPRKGKIYQRGSYFKLYRHGIRHTTSEDLVVRRGGSQGSIAYIGQFAATPPDLGSPAFSDNVFNVAALGPEAWARARSSLTKPEFSPLYQLLELKDFPRLIDGVAKTAVDLAKIRKKPLMPILNSLASLELGYQFGVAPSVKIVGDYAEAVEKAHQRVDQLIRDNRKPVRRRGNLFERETRLSLAPLVGTGASNARPVLVTQCYADLGTAYEETILREKAWYSGRFRYHLPNWVDGSKLSRSRLSRKLHRGDFSPADLYNLIPWSWLLDYFTNAGKMAEAMSRGVEDYLAADYFFVMYSREYVTRRVCQFKVYDSTDFTTHQQVYVSSEKYCELKAREPASMFGFGVSNNSLSSKQTAILGLLGFSRLT